MGLLIMVAGLVLFIGTHAFVSWRAPRAAAIARWGEARYKIAFSLVSVLGIVLIGYGFALYRAAAWVDIWYPPTWTRDIAAVMMWPAVILILVAYLPGHIKRTVKHPMLVGVKLWALAHLIANGDLGSIVLFGSLLAWAVYDRVMVKRREAAGAATRLAISGGWGNDAAAVVAGTVVYLVLGFAFHPLIIGVPAFTS